MNGQKLVSDCVHFHLFTDKLKHMYGNETDKVGI